MKKINKNNMMNDGRKSMPSALKLAVLVIMTFILFMMMFSNSQALGITPGRTTLDFEPGMHKVITLKVINNELKETNVELRVVDELSQYITLSQTILEFKKGEAEKEISYTVDLPETIEKPGSHIAKIVALEKPKETKAGEPTSQVSSVIGVASQLYVNVPYPSAYIEANMQISEAASLEENTTFILQLNNLGKEDTKARIEIDIIKDNKVIAKLKTDEKDIKSKQGAELTAGWRATKQGTYTAKATVYYSGKEAVIEKEFNVGKLALELKRIYVKEYQAEEIAEVSIVVENKWNEQLKNVYGHIIIADYSNNIIGDFKSASVDLAGGATEEIYAYWDTAGIKQDSYTGKIMVHYDDKSIERQLRTRLSATGIDFEIVGVTAEVVASREKGSAINTMLIVFIVLLVLANILWFVYFKRRMKRKK